MKLALISERPKIAKKSENLETIKKYIQHTKADMYVFGEMFLTGYPCKDEWQNLAETKDDESMSFLKDLASKNDCYIVLGMPLKDESVKALIRNAAVLIHPSGKVDVYEKWFLPTFGPFEEKLYFDEGEKLPVFDTKFGKIGLLICYDLYFPELAKAFSLQGADMIICISASPSTTRKYFEMLLPARALENTTYIAYVNLVGTQEDLVFWGGAQVYDALGSCLVKAPYFEPSIVTCEFDPKDVERLRPNRPVLRDTRADLFKDVYEFSRFHEKKNK